MGNNIKSSPYDEFAWFYNRYWTQAMPDLLMDTISRLLLPHLESDAHILDLCCGTGQIVARLAELGFSAEGIDSSAAMLAEARENAPQCTFTQGSAESFTIRRPADAVVCLFDSINHILTPEALSQVFTSVHRALKPGGIFLFDFNNAQGFADNHERSLSVVNDEHIGVIFSYFSPRTRMNEHRVTLMEKGEHDLWTRKDISIIERAYEVDTIMDLLSEAGFSSLQIIDGLDDLDNEAYEGRFFGMGWR